MSWAHEGDGYHLLCNRDESRARGIALPPSCELVDTVRVIAPRDRDAGGTWIAVNEYGVTVCLLNGAVLGWSGFARASHASGKIASRGRLPLKLASAHSVREIGERVSSMQLSEYPPFTLVALEPCEPAAIVEWNGEECAVVLDGDRYMPLCSSSYDAAGVRSARGQEFDRIVAGTPPNSDLLSAFHESHRGGSAPDANAYSPCMHRADAQTVSFSWITVSPESARFFYAPGAPCECQVGALTHLGRAV